MLIDLIIALVLVGVCLYIISLIPMDETIKTVIRVVVLLVVLLWVVRAFGFFGSSGPIGGSLRY